MYWETQLVDFVEHFENLCPSSQALKISTACTYVRNLCDIQQTCLKTLEVCDHVFCTGWSCANIDIMGSPRVTSLFQKFEEN